MAEVPKYDDTQEVSYEDTSPVESDVPSYDDTEAADSLISRGANEAWDIAKGTANKMVGGVKGLYQLGKMAGKEALQDTGFMEKQGPTELDKIKENPGEAAGQFARNASEGMSLVNIPKDLQSEAETQIAKYGAAIPEELQKILGMDTSAVYNNIYKDRNPQDLTEANVKSEEELTKKLPLTSATGRIAGTTALAGPAIALGAPAVPVISAIAAAQQGSKKYQETGSVYEGLKEAGEEGVANTLLAKGLEAAAPAAKSAVAKGASTEETAVRSGMQNWLESKANQKAVESLKLTPSEYAKLEKQGLVQQLGQQLRSKDVVNPLASNKGMASKISEIKESAGDSIGNYIKDYDQAVKANPLEAKPFDFQAIIFDTEKQIAQLERTNKAAADALRGKLEEFKKYAGGPGQVEQVPTGILDARGNPITEEVHIPAPEKRTLGEVQRFKKGVADKAYVEGGTSGDDARAALKSFERRIDEEIFNTLDQTNASKAEGYQRAKEDYRFGTKLEKIANRAAAKEALKPAITGQEAAATVVSSMTHDPTAALTFAAKRGIGAYGKQMASGAYGAAAKTVGGLKSLAEMLKQPDQMLHPAIAKHAATLRKAIARGGNSLAATNYILSQTDPAYRQWSEAESEKERATQQP